MVSGETMTKPTETLYLQRGPVTPWGTADAKYEYGPGINFYITPGHGGFKVNATPNQRIPKPFRNNDGWYEEDVEAAIVLYFLLDDTDATPTLHNHYPHEWQAATGETLTLDQSQKLREEAFWATHTNDLVGISAFGDWAHWVPEGMVGVVAKVGGRKTQGPKRWFLVPKAEYATREPFGFVIDPATHREVPEPANPGRLK